MTPIWISSFNSDLIVANMKLVLPAPGEAIKLIEYAPASFIRCRFFRAI
jgi:hypothetical protein